MKETKTVVVLGGSSGIGLAIAQRFAREKWQVIIASSDKRKVDAAQKKLNGQGHLGLELDVRSTASIDRFMEGVKSQGISRFDALINSVGVSEPHHPIHSDFDQWDNCLQVMLYGSVKTSRAMVPMIPRGGRIIFVTSIHHNRVERNNSSYGMAKAAITQLTRSLALELSSKEILANAIAPGFIDTPMSVSKDGENELDTAWFHDNYVKYDHLPLKRAGKPEEVAGAAYFLAGPDASYITGAVLTIDGGLTITF